MVSRSFLVLTFLLATSTAVSAQKGVRTSASSDFDFEAVESYSWKSRPERNAFALKDGGPLDRAIRRGVDQVLEKTGLRRVEEGGDLILSYDGVIIDSFISPDRFEVVDNVSPGAIAGPVGQSLQQGTLILTAYEPGSDTAVWSGIGRKNLGTQMAVTDSGPLRRKAESLAKKIARAFPR